MLNSDFIIFEIYIYILYEICINNDDFQNYMKK